MIGDCVREPRGENMEDKVFMSPKLLLQTFQMSLY